jgi:hypothetical protein
MKKLTYFIGFIGSVSISVGETFILLHLPGANKLFLTGFFMLLLVFVPLLLVDKYKSGFFGIRSERIKLILGGISSIILGFSGLFKILHLQGADVLLIMGTLIFALGFLPMYFYSMYRMSIG